MKKAVASLVPPLMAILLLSGEVLAERGVPITERARPDYDSLGIRGAFLIKPQLALGVAHSDNIYATEEDEVPAWITTVAPSVDARSDWSRHALRIKAGVEAGYHSAARSSDRDSDISSEDYLDGHLFVGTRLDARRDSNLSVRAGVQRLHEERGAPGSVSAWDEPPVYIRSSGDAFYHHGGRFSLTLGGEIVDLSYLDVDLVGGGKESLAERDRATYTAKARTAFAVTPAVKPFIEGRYEWRRYDQLPVSGITRDSEGFRVGVGTGFDFGGVTSGELFAGYMRQEYEDDDFYDPISGPWYGISLLWNATSLTSVQLTVQNSVKETVAFGSSGIKAIEAGFRIDQELLRNLLAGLFFDYADYSYEGLKLDEKYYVGGPKLTYLWNRHLSSELGFTSRRKESDFAAREYSENRFMFTLTGGF